MTFDPREHPLHISSMKAMARSAKYYRYALEQPRESKALTFGSAVHSLVLGGKKVVPYAERRAGKAWEAFEEKHASCLILNEKDYARADRMASAVLLDDVAAGWIKWADHEVKIEWELAGRKIESTVDCLGHNFIADLKTTRSADPRRFPYDVRRMHYAAQIAWYQDAAAWKTRRTFKQGFIIAVEGEPPHDVVTYELTPQLLEQGRMQARAWFEQILACEAANQWPGYAQNVVPLDVQEDEDGIGLVIDGEEVEVE